MNSIWRPTGKGCRRRGPCGAPFAVLALVIGLDSDVRDVPEGTYLDGPLDGQFVAIAPVEAAVFPVEAKSLRSEMLNPAFRGKLKVAAMIMRLVAGVLGS